MFRALGAVASGENPNLADYFAASQCKTISRYYNSTYLECTLKGRMS